MASPNECNGCGQTFPATALTQHPSGAPDGTTDGYCVDCENADEEEMGLCEYTCRAETSGDIARVREAWVKGGVKIEGATITPETIMGVPIPDCEWNVAVSSAHTLDDLVRIAKTVPDSHVIAETLKRKEDYTGERA